MGRLMGAIAATLLVAGCAKDDRRSCTVTQTRCSGSVIEICDGAAWSALNDCATNGLVCSTSSGDAVCTNAAEGTQVNIDKTRMAHQASA